MKDKRLIARFRCGNELRGEQFWRKEENVGFVEKKKT